MITERGTPGSVVISGAARGIGRATAELFLSRGWRVGCTTSTRDAVADAAAGRVRRGARRARRPRRRAVAGGARTTSAATGGLDVLVNNAGVLASGPFIGTDARGATGGWSTSTSPASSTVPRRATGVPAAVAAWPAAQPVLGVRAVRAADARHLRRDEGRGQVAHRGAGHRVGGGDGDPGTQPAAAVRRDRDGHAATAVRAASVARLGVRLTADDVAAAAWKVVHERRRPLAAPHRPVGRQTRLLAAASAVTPDWANRLVVARLAR